MNDGFNRTAVLLLSDLSRPQIALLAVLALGVVFLTFVDVRELSRWRRAVLVGLRASVLCVAFALVLEPAVEFEHVTTVRNHVAVLVDVSESQALEAGEATRMARARAAVEQLAARFDEEDREHEFELIAFDATSRPTSVHDLRAGQPSGDETRILEAIRSFAEQRAAREIGGVVVISDGVDSGELGARVPRGAALDSESLAVLEALDAPIHTIATAAPGELRDVAISRAVHDQFAFVRNAVSVRVELRALGYDQVPLSVTLRRGADVLQTREVRVEPGATTASVVFEFVPEIIGKEVYTVETPLLDGEALVENNRAYFVLDVIRDKIRVLQVVGRPSWDVRFLRQLLQNNPNVDLICFFILRTNDDIHRGAERELSLIPFPTDELFNEQLGSFDLVVFQNFDYGPYDMRRYLPRIRDYVNDGGGFVMVGGDLSFQSGDYAQTEIAEILPVGLPSTSARDALIDLDGFRPRLTDAGQRHPITRLAFDALDNRSLWESLPPMRGTNVVGPARDGAIVLAAHPERVAGDGAMPVVAVSEVGEGRSMAVTYDSSWRWNFEGVSRGGESQPYTAFWNSAIRWLIRDPALNLVDVELPQDVVAPGVVVAGTVRVVGADYAPAVGAEVSLRVERRSLDDLGASSAEVVRDELLQADELGTVSFEVMNGEPGAYEVIATVSGEGGHEDRDAEVFLSVPSSDELRDIEPRPDLLAAIADATGGDALEPEDRAAGLEFSPARVEAVDRRRVVHLWDAPWVLAALVALLGLEWVLRRRWGRA